MIKVRLAHAIPSGLRGISPSEYAFVRDLRVDELEALADAEPDEILARITGLSHFMVTPHGERSREYLSRPCGRKERFMKNFVGELAQAKVRLADAEAALTAGVNPYAEKNVATHRARVARLETEASVAAPEPIAPAAAIVPPSESIAAAPKSKSTPIITGTREERLERLAKAHAAGALVLQDAVARGLSPDEFAIELAEMRDPDALAVRIAKADKPVTRKAAPEVENMVQRILEA